MIRLLGVIGFIAMAVSLVIIATAPHSDAIRIPTPISQPRRIPTVSVRPPHVPRGWWVTRSAASTAAGRRPYLPRRPTATVRLTSSGSRAGAHWGVVGKCDSRCSAR